MKSELDEQIETLVLLQEVRELNESRRKENAVLLEQLEQSIQQLADQRKLIESKDRYNDTLQNQIIKNALAHQDQIKDIKHVITERDILKEAVQRIASRGRGVLKKIAQEAIQKIVNP